MNKETLRRNKLFSLMAQQQQYKPASYYSNLLSVSEKTLYNDVNFLNDEIACFGLKIEKIPRKGLKLSGKKEDIEKYNSLHLYSSEDDYSPISRQRKIAQLIFLSNTSVDVNDLEERMFVSKTPIRNDIQILKKYFSKKNVELLLENNYIVVSGKEVDIQNAYQNYEIDYFKKSRMLTVRGISNEMVDVFDKSIIEEASNIVLKLTNQKQQGLSEAYGSALFFSLCVLLTRVKNDHHIKEDTKRFVFQDIEKMETYMLAMNTSMQVSNKLGIILDEYDIKFLSELFFSYGIEPTVNKNIVNDNFKFAVEECIEKMSQLLKTDLTDDDKLYESLLAHAAPMIYRLKNGFLVKNPLMSSIKRQYMVMFTLTWYVSAVFENRFGVQMNDDEVSFLTIYFQIAFAKKSKPKNILIVCPNGLAISELVYAQIKDILPANDHIEVATISQVLQNDIQDVEFIISLVPSEQFKGVNKKIFYVSPLITQQELDEISKYYGSINQNMRTLRSVGKVNLVELTNYFDDNFLYWQYDFTSKEQVLDFMISQYEKYDLVTEEFRDSIYGRESEGVTTISQSVAMPHAATKTVKKTLISIMTLQKSVKWGESDVNTVIMVAVSEKDVDDIREIISKIYDLIETKDKSNLLTKVRSTNEFAILLQEQSNREDI